MRSFSNKVTLEEVRLLLYQNYNPERESYNPSEHWRGCKGLLMFADYIERWIGDNIFDWSKKKNDLLWLPICDFVDHYPVSAHTMKLLQKYYQNAGECTMYLFLGGKINFRKHKGVGKKAILEVKKAFASCGFRFL